MTTEATIKMRPIIFSGEMVRAILDGSKTQTRRLIKPQPANVDAAGRWYRMPSGGLSLNCYDCPYGRPGDRLWVRETWSYAVMRSVIDGSDVVVTSYRAIEGAMMLGGRWRPSIHMPRGASRLTLEITEVRVQRLCDLSHEDCLAEGISGLEMARGILSENPPDPRWRFIELWNSINGKRAPWAANPWVWALTFKVVEG